MTGFVADTRQKSELPISNGGFWPDIDPENCRAVVRLDQSVTPDRLREALISAMISINLDNQQWGATQEANSYTTLGDVPAPQIDGQSIKISLYTRAVYCFAKAELIERYRDYDATASGAQRGDGMTETVDDYRRQGIVAVRDMIGEPRTTVELI